MNARWKIQVYLPNMVTWLDVFNGKLGKVIYTVPFVPWIRHWAMIFYQINFRRPLKKKHLPAKDLATIILATQISLYPIAKAILLRNTWQDTSLPIVQRYPCTNFHTFCVQLMQLYELNHSYKKVHKLLGYLVVEPPPLKNMLVKMGIFPKVRGENKTYLKPPPISWPLFDIVCFVTGAFRLQPSTKMRDNDKGSNAKWLKWRYLRSWT